MKKILLYVLLSFLTVISVSAQDTTDNKKTRPEKSFLRQDRSWTVEIPIWVPGFRGEYAYGEVTVEAEDGQNPGVPDHPIEPPEPGEPPWGGGNIFSRLFTSSSYLKFFAMSKVTYKKNRFLVQADMFSGAVGNSLNFRFNDKTVVQANIRTTLIRSFAGYAIINKENKSKKLRYELFGYAGVRVHVVKVFSDLDRINIINKLDINPVWVSPILGVKNQLTLKNWLFILQGDMGGYFDETKYSYMINAFAYYRLSNLLSLKFGWTDWDMNHNSDFRGENLKIKVHLSGPSTGLNFHF